MQVCVRVRHIRAGHLPRRCFSDAFGSTVLPSRHSLDFTPAAGRSSLQLRVLLSISPTSWPRSSSIPQPQEQIPKTAASQPKNVGSVQQGSCVDESRVPRTSEQAELRLTQGSHGATHVDPKDIRLHRALGRCSVRRTTWIPRKQTFN